MNARPEIGDVVERHRADVAAEDGLDARRALHVDPYQGAGVVGDVDRHRALGQAGERGAGRRVGDAPVAGAIVADGVDVTLVPGARLLVFAGESELAAVGPPGEFVRRPSR